MTMTAIPDTITTPATDIAMAVTSAFAPCWSVSLWNDDSIDIAVPVEALRIVVGLPQEEAVILTFHAHMHGKAVIATTTFEQAEHYRAQLTEKYRLTVTIERQSA